MEINRRLSQGCIVGFLVLAMFGQGGCRFEYPDGPRARIRYGSRCRTQASGNPAFSRVARKRHRMDVMASSGYYTEVLAHAVGSEGTVTPKTRR
ncbi:MAG: hypothetical protein Ct9H300mP8_13460 [Gammaproteobacteria bacterium]|nr:MAG: hypothetical protein Ct9H300mP8_13460 [Gammaproteobacteria bacterium]